MLLVLSKLIFCLFCHDATAHNSVTSTTLPYYNNGQQQHDDNKRWQQVKDDDKGRQQGMPMRRWQGETTRGETMRGNNDKVTFFYLLTFNLLLNTRTTKTSTLWMTRWQQHHRRMTTRMMTQTTHMRTVQTKTMQKTTTTTMREVSSRASKCPSPCSLYVFLVLCFILHYYLRQQSSTRQPNGWHGRCNNLTSKH